MTPGLEPGTEFAGHRIVGVLGRGGMGVVYRAVHLGLERTVALKVLAAELAGQDEFRRRFRRESRLAASLDHPSVVTIFEAGEHAGRLFVTMRFVPGPDLGRQLRAAGPLAPARAAEVVGHLADALGTAHGHGLVHRDVKPANVLLEGGGDSALRVFLADFGLAKGLDATTGPTSTGRWIGTVDYAAPEQIGDGHADARTDLYALGGVLYTALTGEAPYVRPTVPAVMWAHTHDRPPSLAGRGAGPAAFDAVVARAMAKEPGERFASAEELGAAVREAAAGLDAPEPLELACGPPLPVPSPAVATPSPTAAPTAAPRELATLIVSEPAARVPRSPGRSRGRLLGLAGLAAAALAALAVVLFVSGGDAEGSGALEAERLAVDPVSLPGEPAGVAVVGDTAWAPVETDDDEHVLASVAGLEPGAELPLATGASAIATGDRQLWLQLGSDGLQRVDAEEAVAIGGPIDVGSVGQGQVAVGEGAVWVADPIGDTVVRVDPGSSRAVGDPIPVPAGVDGPIAAGEGAVWVVGSDIEADALSVTPIDPGMGEAGDAVRVGEFASSGTIAAGEGGIWVGDPGAEAVRRVDPGSRELDRRTVPVEGGASDLATGGGAVWALDGDADNAVRIDPERVRRAGQAAPVAGGSDARIAVGETVAWVASPESSALVRMRW